MQFVYIALTVTILGGKPAPEVTVAHEGIWDRAECESWKADMEKAAPKSTDATGRPILSRQYVCQPGDLNDLQRLIDKAKK